LTEVLNRHFPKIIDDETLAQWFKEAAASVFGQYGDEWVASVCRGTRQGVLKLKPLKRLLAPATKKHRLEAHAEKIEAGFLAFLRSENTADHGYLMSLWASPGFPDTELSYMMNSEVSHGKTGVQPGVQGGGGPAGG
jgi:hypothetical protein